MPTGPLTVALWDGKKEIGNLYFRGDLIGKFAVFYLENISLLKEPYNRRRKYETIEIPIIHRTISDNGVDMVIRRSLDVRKKSKRQKKALLEAYGEK